jgi:hypothetical protein
MANKKYTLKEVKSLSPGALLNLINRAKKFLKTDDTMIGVCKDYNQDIDSIDLIPVMFDDIDTSAKTDHGIVILNYKLLTDGDFFKDYSYLVHEFTHFFQQTCSDKPTKGSDEGNYLDNPYEEEGFQNQVGFIADNFGEPEAEKYVDNLLDYHKLDSGKEKKEKKEELLAKV